MGNDGPPLLGRPDTLPYDNALFSTYARTGITVGGPRSQLGLTSVAYRSWGKPDGKPTYYTHRPFLLKAVFQLWVRRFGDSEFSSRAFALGVSMLAAAGTVVALTIATGARWRPSWGRR